MSISSPSWNLSRHVRATIICNGLSITGDTASAERIKEIAANLAGNGHDEVAGYDVATVRMILLDESVRSPYPPEPPEQYVGK